ncbi:U4/U6.U5 tri-snRNP-associated protein 2 [Cichlidogyrus casuarinus]|uniref:ubiquitinyl hydrolase 1 n=1 Tax=Cichlidogyrus casuarinus TaxID=1844966 RepID=A0ABD2PRT2_9PLAT
MKRKNTVILEDVPVKKVKDGITNNNSQNFSDDEEPVNAVSSHLSKNEKISISCPYLDTINRSILDFDFEKLCSISLSHLNVYACLICGKYFQGRGPSTHAHTHSVSEGHHVFLNLETQNFYCLPDNYQVKDSSLDDINYLLNPVFQPSIITSLDKNDKQTRAYDETKYYPGIVGLNNIKANDYCNVMLQLLGHIPPLRNFFLIPKNYDDIPKQPGDQMLLLVQRFGELIRKLWNHHLFKSHVSPHDFLQAVVLCSNKRFQFTEQADSVEFFTWLINSLNHSLKLKGKPLSSTIISKSLRGSMRIHSKKMPPPDLRPEQVKILMQDPEYADERTEETKFLYLTCDLPPAPLYLDELKENIIPQVPLLNLLVKFNGISEKEYKTHNDSSLKRFEIMRLPPYLCLYMKRIVKNIFTLEKNPTIVNFPIKAVDFGEYLLPKYRATHKYTTYNLIANVVHDGPPALGVGTHRIQVLNQGSGKWFEMQDLHVREVLPQMITLSESLFQLWQVDKTVPNPFYKETASE